MKHVHVRCRLETKQDYSSNEWKSKNTADLVVLIGETISLFFSLLNLVGIFTHHFFMLNIVVEPSAGSASIASVVN